MRFLRKVATRGNLTLPSDIREALDIDQGDIVEFAVIGVVRKHAPRDDTPHNDRNTPAPVGGTA